MCIRDRAETNRDALIVGLVEDGLFDHTIWFPVALFAELLWDDRTPVEDLLVKVAMRPDAVSYTHLDVYKRQEKYRNLPYIGVLKPEVYEA